MMIWMYLWRILVLGLALLITVRLIGKQAVGRNTPIDFIAGITMGTIAGSSVITRSIPLWVGVLALFGWAAFVWINAILVERSPGYRRLAVGQSTVLAQDGHLVRKGLATVHLPASTVKSALRMKQTTLGSVDRMTLEPSGKYGVQKKSGSGAKTTAEKQSDNSPDDQS